MSVLFITRKFPPSVGGMEIYSQRLFEAMHSIRSDVELFKPTRDIIGRPSIWRMLLFFLAASWQLFKQRRTYKAVLLGDFALASLAPVAKIVTLGRARVVISLHGNDLYFMRKRNALAFGYRQICRFVMASKALDAAIANSSSVQTEAKRRGISPVSIIPLGTVVPESTSTSAEKRNAILFAGRLIRYKGLSWFVKCVWPKLDGNLELLVAGDVWDKSEYDCLRGRARISYLGSLPHNDLLNLYSDVLACIMPNIPPRATEQDEGFGLVALEAPAVGTPIIAAKCGGLPDAVVEGITGFLVPSGDVDAWVERLRDVTRWHPNQRAAFGDSAIACIRDKYCWSRVAAQTIKVLEGNGPHPER